MNNPINGIMYTQFAFVFAVIVVTSLIMFAGDLASSVYQEYNGRKRVF